LFANATAARFFPRRAMSALSHRLLIILDTAGEVIFAPARTLTPQVFKGLPHVNHGYFGLRQQYQNRGRATFI
jgi:hypothetical protein